MKMILSVLLSGLLSSTCFAFDRQGRHEISPLLGMNYPTGEVNFSSIGGGSSKMGSSGFMGGFQYLYNIKPRFAIGAETAFLNRGEVESSTLIPRAISTIS